VRIWYIKVNEDKNLVNHCKTCSYEEVVESIESKVIINVSYAEVSAAARRTPAGCAALTPLMRRRVRPLNEYYRPVQ
jgi:hypothetical protein